MNKAKRLFISMLTLLCCSTGAWASSIPGALSGRFTINASGEKVVFSQGNLQYVGTWQFAENQWDCFSTSQYNDHRDLFGWGTGDAPNKVSDNNGDYGTFTDWGTNAITNGGNTENSGWRTLTKDEWVYLFYSRENAATLFGFGSVNGMNGLIILPDNWTTPEGASFTASTTLGLTNLGSYYHNDNNDNYSHNTYTAKQWAVMESAGAVFLPAAAYRHWDLNIKYTDLGGFYWSSTPYDSDKAYYLNFYYNDLDPQFKEMRYGGRPVRLVRSSLQQDAEGYYLLGSADDWKDFAAIVNTGTNPAANAKMTADIDLGDDQTHIGSLAEEANPKYAGVFDGQGHTLTVNYVGGSNQIVAPFTQTNNATIKNLHIAGSIQSSFAYIGVVGMAGSGSVISKVWMSATMNTTQDGWVQSAAIAGYCNGTIQDCLFTGTFTCNDTGGGMGGFYGYTNGSPTITNCLSTGTFNYGNWQGSGVHTNCYLKQYPADLTTGCSWATNETLSDGTIATALQNSRAEEVWVQDPMTNQPMLKLFATKAYTVPSSGIGTFSAKAKFTVPAGLTAHYCKTYNSANGTIGVVNIDVDDAVPANTGVLLKGTPGETYTLTGTNSDEATVEGNALVAVTEATHVDPIDGGYTNFMMSSGKFIKIEASDDPNVKMPANRAYLKILTSDLPSSLARGITLSWDDDATSISEMEKWRNGENEKFYDLQGRLIVNGKLSNGKLPKGLYINNGRKVVIK